MVSPLSPTWAAFGRIQQSIENERFATGDAFADDVALTDLVDDFESGEPPAGEIPRRFHSLRLNRRRKYRCRRKLYDAPYFCGRPHESAESPAKRVESADEFEWVRRNTCDVEWGTLTRIAAGTSHQALAAIAGVSLVAFRVSLYRLRARLAAVA